MVRSWRLGRSLARVPKRQFGHCYLANGAHSIECTNSLLRSESPNQQLVGLGLDDIIAITMPDAVLVANKEKAQSVKKVVDFLKLNNIQQAEIFQKIIDRGDGLKVSFVEINFK